MTNLRDPYRTSNLILKEKASQFNTNPEILAPLAEINEDYSSEAMFFSKYNSGKATELQTRSFDRSKIASRGLR
jgi:hypothetical protein